MYDSVRRCVATTFFSFLFFPPIVTIVSFSRSFAVALSRFRLGSSSSSVRRRVLIRLGRKFPAQLRGLRIMEGLKMIAA